MEIIIIAPAILPIPDNGWKNHFTFQNGNSTTATLDIKNNAPGGGGNDWALDDITMTQCLVVLPIQLESFTGRSTAQGNVLDWQLNPSPDLRSFTIERSSDGLSFLPVGRAASLSRQYSLPVYRSAAVFLRRRPLLSYPAGGHQRNNKL